MRRKNRMIKEDLTSHKVRNPLRKKEKKGVELRMDTRTMVCLTCGTKEKYGSEVTREEAVKKYVDFNKIHKH